MISKKKLLAIDKMRKQKLYDQKGGKSPMSESSRRVGILFGALVVLLGGGYFLFSANTIEPVKEEELITELKPEVVVVEEKEVAVIEEVPVELHPSLKDKAAEPAKAPDEVDLTFYDDLSTVEGAMVIGENKPKTAQQQDQESRKVEIPSTPAIKEKRTVVKSYAKKPQPATPVVKNVAVSPISASTPTSPQPTRGVFRVQVASFRSPEEATRRKQQLNSDGFTATVEMIDLGTKGVWHRVYVGDYPTRLAARGDIERIAKKYNIKPILQRKP